MVRPHEEKGSVVRDDVIIVSWPRRMCQRECAPKPPGESASPAGNCASAQSNLSSASSFPMNAWHQIRRSSMNFTRIALAGLLLTAASLCARADEPAPKPARPEVEVVFCLDTTGSMGGLIDAAKKKIWSISNQISSGNPTPHVKIGLVAFRDRGDDYITKVFD